MGATGKNWEWEADFVLERVQQEIVTVLGMRAVSENSVCDDLFLLSWDGVILAPWEQGLHS